MGWEQDYQFAQMLRLILAKETQILSAINKLNIADLQHQLNNQNELLNLLTQYIKSLVPSLESALAKLQTDQAACCQATNAKLDTLIKALIPPPAVKCYAVITLDNQDNQQGEDNIMPQAKKAAKASADLVVDETSGTFTVALKFLDADDAPTATPAGLSASYTDSTANPGPDYLTLTPSADTSSAAGSVNQAVAKAQNDAGVPLPTGITVTGTATWTGLASPASFTAAPAIDLVAGAAGQVAATASTP